MTKTLFQKIIDRELPAKIIFEDELCLAFPDINPAAPTHILIVPKQSIDQIEHMTATDEGLIGHLFFSATQIAQQLGLDQGYRLVINNGAGAGQSVFHLHIHLLAGRAFGWPPG